MAGSDATPGDEQDPLSHDKQWTFDENWAAQGVNEAALRRHTTPPPSVPTGTPRNVVGAPAGPRDWTPSAARPGTGRQARGRRPWVWLGVVAVAVVAATFAVSLIRHHGSSGNPIGQPVPSAGAIPSGTPVPTASDTETAVRNVSPTTAVGSCFDLPSGRTVITARFRPCSAKHHFQLVALERAAGTNDAYPSAAYWSGPVQARCTKDLVRFTGQSEQNWPPALRVSALQPRRAGWATGDRAVYCLGEFAPARAGTLRHLKAYRPGSAIAATEGPATITITGQLIVTSLGQNLCLAVRGRTGSPVPVGPASSTYSWLAETAADGSADDARSGIATGPKPVVSKIVKHAGSPVTLTGTYSSPDLLGCGGSREFDFSTVR